MFTPLAYLALFGWPAFVILLFAIRPHRQAATIAVIGAWLLLPPYSIDFPGLPDYGKNVAASIGILLATLIFAPDRLLAFRPRWFDLPMVLFCFSASASSISNGLGLYDAASELLKHIFIWGLPYLFGRLYFGTAEDLRGLVVGVAIGGLSYVLPCLYESRMSPSLLQNIYGYAHSMLESRWGGWRPNVFFWTGLECGMWMTAASLAAWWLWRCGALRRLGPFPFGLALTALLLTTIICRSTGALLLLIMGIFGLWASSRFRTHLLLAGLLLVGPIYVGVRLPELWSGKQAVDLAKYLFGPDRAQSLEWRFQCERMLGDKALRQPILGWGGFGRSLVYFGEEGGWNVPPDGLWILMMGSRGYVGMTLVYLVFALPAALFVRRFPARLWGDPRLAAASLAAALLGLFIVDCLMNAFVNIIYVTMAGGLISLDPRRVLTPGAPGHEAEAAGRRRGAGRPSPTRGATAASGRALLADRCRTLGRSFKLEGRLDEADAAWRQAIELLAALIEAHPGADELRRRWCDCANDLAWMRANHPDPARRDPNSAVSLARRSVDEYPDAAAYRNTLGAALYRAGEPREAIEALERARDLGGGTAFDEVFLAMARARTGEMEAARQALARAMLQAERDYPGHPELSALCDEAQALIAGVAPAAIS